MATATDKSRMDSASDPDVGRRGERRYTTISIPQPLYHEIKKAIEGTGFRSPTEFMVYITRLSLQSPLVRAEPGAPPTAPPASWNPFAARSPYYGR